MKRYKKPYKVKKRKSVLRNRFFWLAVLILIIIGGICYFLFFSGIFQIKKITIIGGEKVGEENVRALIPENSIFLIDAQKIKKEILENFPEIAKAETRRSFPGTLEILLVERVPAAVWCELEKCFLIDNEGALFGENKIKTDLIKISGAKEILNKEKISQILKIQKELSVKLIATTTQAFIISEERLNIKTSEGWEIYFNLKGDLDWQVRELSLVLEKQVSPEERRNLEYVDLRFSRVYYR